MKRILIAIIFFTGLATFTGLNSQQIMPTQSQKLRLAEMAISQFYVDTVDENKLVEDAIKAMLEGLDPHSQYSNAEETRELNEPLSGNFSGIGITFNMNRDTLYVIQTVAGGPSEKVGILPGDRIIGVNDTVIAGVGMKNTDIMKRLRGPKGSSVDVTVLRQHSGNIPDTVAFSITRDDIPIYSIDASYMVDDKTGYIRLSRFGAETAKEFRTAVKNLQKSGMEKLILDLTDNGGGYLNSAVEILGELLEPGMLTVYTEGLNSPRQDHLSHPSGKKPLLADGDLVIMVNQYSASASEITAGAIQDWDRGVVVGRRTFGKGLVQRPIPFPDGSMIRLTVAHYYTPTGRDIQKPYEKGNSKAYRDDIIERFKNGELMHEDSIHTVDSLRLETLRTKRPIYSGGGIYPDRFVAVDTSLNSKYYRDIVAKGLLNRYVISYVDQNRELVKKSYKNDSDFVKNFTVTQEMLDDLYSLAEAEGIERNEEEALLSIPLFEMGIKGLIGRDIYENATYFKVYNQLDPLFKEAYRVINSPEYYEILNGEKP